MAAATGWSGRDDAGCDLGGGGWRCGSLRRRLEAPRVMVADQRPIGRMLLGRRPHQDLVEPRQLRGGAPDQAVDPVDHRTAARSGRTRDAGQHEPRVAGDPKVPRRLRRQRRSGDRARKRLRRFEPGRASGRADPDRWLRLRLDLERRRGAVISRGCAGGGSRRPGPAGSAARRDGTKGASRPSRPRSPTTAVRQTVGLR